MALGEAAEDRAVDVLLDRYPRLLRLARLVHALGAWAGIDRSSQEPSNPARQLHVSAPRLRFTRYRHAPLAAACTDRIPPDGRLQPSVAPRHTGHSAGPRAQQSRSRQATLPAARRQPRAPRDGLFCKPGPGSVSPRAGHADANLIFGV